MIKLKLFLVQASILFFALILIEGMLRIVNSDMTNYDIEMWRYAKELKQADSLFGHKHIKNKSSILQGVEIKLNSRGMRSDEFKNDEKKILFLGSSISLGWGVELNDSYPQIIQTKLLLDSINYKVLNGSVGNYNTFRYVNNFLDNNDDINPNIIVINYFINDVETLPIGSSNWFLQNSQLIASLTMAYKKLFAKSGLDLKSYYKNLYLEDNPSFIEMNNSLVKLSKYSKKTNTPILLVVIPDIHFLENYPFELIHKKMKNISLDLEFEYHDLLPSLKGISFEKLQIIPGDSHPNAYGHKKMAETLYPILKEVILQ
jgi:lysophospholipase L1-like esterase